jgi:hypothetical protein
MTVGLFGFIGCSTSDNREAHNCLQLQQLPTAGGYLARHQFSFVPYSRWDAYYGSYIHFAMGYKEFYCLDPKWIDEFESFLSRLYWDKAELILTWSLERYVWISDYSHDCPNDVPNKILHRARFESAWDLKAIPWDS